MVNVIDMTSIDEVANTTQRSSSLPSSSQETPSSSKTQYTKDRIATLQYDEVKTFIFPQRNPHPTKSNQNGYCKECDFYFVFTPSKDSSKVSSL